MTISQATPLKLVVLISGSGSNLQAFIDQIAAKQLNAEICAVISNKAEAYGLERARKANIPAIIISHKDFESREDFDQALIEEIKQHSPDLIILAGFMRILTEGFINAFSDQILNIHPSLLPKYKGLNTHQRALDAGDQYHGASVHLVTLELDDGPVIIQGQLVLKDSDTAESLQQRIHKIEHQIYPLAVQWLADGKVFINSGKIQPQATLNTVISYAV